MSTEKKGEDVSLDPATTDVTYPSIDVRREVQMVSSSTAQDTDSKSGRNHPQSLWPPWPFNILTTRTSESTNTKSAAGLFYKYFRQRTRVGVRQLQEVTSQLWFHLPPAAAPLVLLASIPRTTTTLDGTRKVVVPLFSNPFVRTLSLAGLGMAIMSWADAELYRKQNLVPLPLHPSYRDINRAILPQFLPEEVPDPEIDALTTLHARDKDEANDEMSDEALGSTGLFLSPRLRRNFNAVASRPHTLKETWFEWRRMRQNQKRESLKIRRQAIFDELIAWQVLKRDAVRRKKKARTPPSTTEETVVSEPPPLGYALVTGASRGIGRAIAVELARWEIPLILVARDTDRLTSLAYDLEACYGIKCVVMPADLSEPKAAEYIHRTTQKAGLRVDILVNNAGIAVRGLATDMSLDDIQRMIQLNVNSVAVLNRLYGRDMKAQQRGRILVVSSMMGAVNAGPYVAVYAATKAFERTLASSMGKELEPYGVGVTCLMPGAVSDTEFKSNSHSDDALVWKIPFYPRKPSQVAAQGVRSLLKGDVEVKPGWQNRAFLNVANPLLPTRIHDLLVQWCWTPMQFSLPGFWRKDRTPKDQPEEPVDGIPNLRPRYNFQPAPRLLRLLEDPPLVETIITPLEKDNATKWNASDTSAMGDSMEEGGTVDASAAKTFYGGHTNPNSTDTSSEEG